MGLCLLVSRRCNLRCGFCRVEFTGEDMPWRTARLAVRRYLDAFPGEAVVKFFGGEPLMNWEVIHKLIEAGRGEWARHGLRFELPTNGTLLDPEKRGYLLGRPEAAVTLSFMAPGGSSLPGVWFTMVLERGCRPEKVVSRLASLIRAGYRRFNFLPAYYIAWAREDVQELRRSFAVVARVLIGLQRLGKPVRIKNIETSGSVSLFNDALTVDVDGTVYASNMIQCGGMERARDALRLGSVFEPCLDLSVARGKISLAESFVRDWAGPEAWESTLQVDEALTEFVATLRRGMFGLKPAALADRSGLRGVPCEA